MSESDKKQIYKPRPVTGFPEWLPEERLVEQQWFDHIRAVFESYGFCSIETPSVEELDVIRAKGEVDKEIYVIERLHKDKDGGDTSEARLALHFDQTVPLARYVAQRFNDLVFPFKRYQIQRVWRGERPQAGRFREFYQCDIDVINVDNLPLHFDAEMPAIIWEILTKLPGMENEKIQLRISNKKILTGYLRSAGLRDPAQLVEITRLIDKSEKDPNGVHAQLRALIKKQNHYDAVMYFLIQSAKKYADREEFSETIRETLLAKVERLPSFDPVFQQGIEELEFMLESLKHLPQGSVVVDLAIVRGLDYYTGTVYETVFTDDPKYGSICSGGRYDDLAGSYISRSLPGVGISIGFSRLFDRLRQQKKFDTTRKCPADILMVLPSDAQRAVATETARALRARGFKVELYHAPKKTGDQIKYADRKGIPWVWLPPFEPGQAHEVKYLKTGEQSKADPATWNPGEKTHEIAAA